MALGCFWVALANLVMVAGGLRTRAIGKASWLWLLAYFVVITIGELYLSPIGLSLVTKVAPARIVSMMMGLWFVTSFAGNFIGGWLGSFWSAMDKASFFLMIAAVAAFAGARHPRLQPSAPADPRSLTPAAAKGRFETLSAVAAFPPGIALFRRACPASGAELGGARGSGGKAGGARTILRAGRTPARMLFELRQRRQQHPVFLGRQHAAEIRLPCALATSSILSCTRRPLADSVSTTRRRSASSLLADDVAALTQRIDRARDLVRIETGAGAQLGRR